jgi:hypothetical protein
MYVRPIIIIFNTKFIPFEVISLYNSVQLILEIF